MQTVRQEIISVLGGRELSAREISQILGIREREVYEHLPHIARSMASQGKRLVAVPFRCMGCGHLFTDRKRFTRPGRCPRCKDSHVEEPRFRID